VSEAPYLSVVATARNDDHGGNLLRRMQAFVNGVLIQCERHRVPAELVLVEWNPPPDRPGLAEALDWSARGSFCEVRIVPVPAGIHRRLRHSNVLPLYQMIAKNVGIRRARGGFILATNIDILFSDELFRLIAERRLRPDRMYRVDRWDAMSEVPLEKPIEEQIAWCNSHLVRVNRREGTFQLNPDGSMKIDARDIVSPERGVTLGANWFPREMSGAEPFRWIENDAELILKTPAKFLTLDVEPGPGVENQPFLLELRNAEGATVASVEIGRRSTIALPLQTERRVFLHTDQGGQRIAEDLRVLNFRVFRCEPADAGLTGAAPRARASPLARLGRAARALGAALFSTSEIRIPMSREALDRLDVREDGTAVAFRLGPLLRRGGGSGILAGGLGAIWEDGWHVQERVRHGPYRWMEPHARLTLVLPEGGGSHISLLVEPGPVVGLGDAMLEIRDQGGRLAQTKIAGRTRVEIPVAKRRGAWTLDLSVSGGRAPKITADPRVMAMRLSRCELHPNPQRAGETKFVEAAPGSGIWYAARCSPRPDGLLCLNLARILIRGEDGLSLEAAARDAAAPASITDAHGAVVFEGILGESRNIEIPAPQSGAFVVLHIATDRPILLTAVTRAAGGEKIRIPLASREIFPLHLHTNGCGDFTLLARERWLDLRGYPELDAFSMNIDSMLCWAAHHGGAREEVLPDPVRIFHIEHATGSGWTPEGERNLYHRILAKGLPWIEFDDVLAWAAAMNRFDAPMIFNRENWGLAEETLPETRPRAGL